MNHRVVSGLSLAAAFAAALAAASVASAQTIGSNLVVYYNFNNNLNDTAPSGTMADTGLYQTFNYGANSLQAAAGSPYVPGLIGQGAFVGVDGVGQPLMVNVGDVTNTFSLDLDFGGTSDFSISMWFKYNTSIGGDPSFVSNKNWSSGGNVGYVLARDSGNTVQLNYNEGLGRKDLDAAGPNTGDGQWHHLGASFDREGFFRMFVDGQIVGSVPLQGGGGSLDAFLPTMIGQDGTGHYDGATSAAGLIDFSDLAVDEFGMWKGVRLSTGDFQAIYNAGIGGNALSTVFGTALAPPDPDPVTTEFVYSGASPGSWTPTGNWEVFDLGPPPTQLPATRAPGANKANPLDRDIVNIDNHEVELTDARAINGLNIGFQVGDNATLVMKNGSSLVIGPGSEPYIGVEGTGTLRMEGNSSIIMRGEDINVGGGFNGNTGFLIQEGSSRIDFGDWVVDASRSAGFRKTGGGGDEPTVGEDDNGSAGSGTHVQRGTSILRTGDDYWLADVGGSFGEHIMEDDSKLYIYDRYGVNDDGGPDASVGITRVRDNALLWAEGGIHTNDGGATNATALIEVEDTATINLGDRFYAGENGGGQSTTINQSGGTVNVGAAAIYVRMDGSFEDRGELSIARNAGSNTTWNLSGGTIHGSRESYLGHGGAAVLNQTGGAAHFASGKWNSGTQTWSDGRHISGNYQDSGGDLVIGQNAGSSGTYNLSGGSLTVDGDMVIGNQGAATFKVTSGASSVQIGTGYWFDTAWASTGSRAQKTTGAGFQLREGNLTIGDNGTVIAEITNGHFAGINVHGNVALDGDLQLSVTTPTTGAFLVTIVAADSDNDGNGTLSGNFDSITGVPAGMQTLGRSYALYRWDDAYSLGLRAAGDANFDGIVDIFDVAAISNAWGSANPFADVNGDMMVDIFDVAVVSNNWGNDVGDLPGGASAVPEPGTFALCGFAAVGLLLGRRLRRRSA